MSPHDNSDQAEKEALFAQNKCNNQVFLEMEKIRKSAFPISESESMANLQETITEIMTKGMTKIHKLEPNDEMQRVIISTIEKIDNLIKEEFTFLANSISEHGITSEKVKACCDRIYSQALVIIGGLQTGQLLITKCISELKTIVTNITSKIFNITNNFTAGSWQLFKTWWNMKHRMENIKIKGLRIFDDAIQKNVSKTLAETTNEYRKKAEKDMGRMQQDYEKCITEMGVLLIYETMLTTFYISTKVALSMGLLSLVASNIPQNNAIIAKSAEMVQKFTGVATGVSTVAAAASGAILIYLLGKYVHSPKGEIPEDHVHQYHEKYIQQSFCKRCSG